MMEAARTSETLVNFYQTTRCYNPEDSHLHGIMKMKEHHNVLEWNTQFLAYDDGVNSLGESINKNSKTLLDANIPK
jgi:hypothetical protein